MSELDMDRRRGIRNTLLWLMAFICVILGLFLHNVLNPGLPGDDQLRELGFFHYPEYRPLSAFVLRDNEGVTVDETIFEGRWTLVFFGFTYCPDICPTTMGVLARATTKMSDPPAVILVSVDPERDTAASMDAYVRSFSPTFRGLTGEFDQIVLLASQLNVAFGKVPGPDPNGYLVDHSASIAVINPKGEYVGFIKAPHGELNIATLMGHLMRS
ncbi:MAG: SCO family protein [Pseudomonadota bacterium]